MSAARYLHRPPSAIRRRDRRLEDVEWIDRFLQQAPFGHLAVVFEGAPLLHANLFWHDGDRVYFHTAPVGKLRAVLDLGPTLAVFSVSEHGRILPAETPFDFSVEYASVICYGTAAVVNDPVEKRRALEGLMQKYAAQLTPGVDYEPMPDTDIARTSVLVLTIDERVAKHNVKPDDYPAYACPGESFIDAERAAGRFTLSPKEEA